MPGENIQRKKEKNRKIEKKRTIKCIFYRKETYNKMYFLLSLIYITTKFCISTFDSSHVTIAFINMQSAVFLDVYYCIVYLI